MLEEIRVFIENLSGPIPEEHWLMYKKQITTTKAKKGDVILHFNKPCKTIWHLVTGAARKIEMIEGSTKTTHFYTAPKVFTVLQSALKSIPSDLSIVCDEDCIFLELPFVELQKLYEKSRYIERIGRRIVEEEYIAEFSIRRMFLKMDALERYEYIEKTHPEVLKRFQLKDVATFLGITPETLSRLRKTRFA